MDERPTLRKPETGAADSVLARPDSVTNRHIANLARTAEAKGLWLLSERPEQAFPIHGDVDTVKNFGSNDTVQFLVFIGIEGSDDVRGSLSTNSEGSAIDLTVVVVY